jgi:hypothetical protein
MHNFSVKIRKIRFFGATPILVVWQANSEPTTDQPEPNSHLICSLNSSQNYSFLHDILA